MVSDLERVKKVLKEIESVAHRGCSSNLDTAAMEIIRIIHEPGPKRGIFQ
jgi:hypothetical protein